MNIVNKLKEIVLIQNENSDINNSIFNDPIDEHRVQQIESLLGESLPGEFITLYRFADGQTSGAEGILFGECFMNSGEIINQLQISQSLNKPKDKKVEYNETSEKLLKKIVEFYISVCTRRSFFGIRKKWYKIEFDVGLDSYGGPYLYRNENTPNEREIVSIDNKSYDKLSEIIKEIHELEKQSCNWDQLHFEVYSNGDFKVERKFYDFEKDIEFSSIPANAIKKKYFHFKWLPVFSDYGGNYIGIDLDPDVNGKKGQIIIFGRDEENMIVLADNLDDFFSFVLKETKTPGHKLLDLESHLHDILKDIKMNQF